MKNLPTIVAMSVLTILPGCERGASGGPGVTSPSPAPGIMSQAEDTFSLVVPSAELMQGGDEAVTIGIRRGQNFGQDVSLSLSALPEGVRLVTANPRIEHGDTDIEISLLAAEDAALGDFTITVTGRPATGAAATAEMKLAIAEYDPDATTPDESAAARELWNRETLAMETELSQLAAKYDALQKRVSDAVGQEKADLTNLAVQAKIDYDTLAAQLAERMTEGESAWERIKQSVKDGLDGN